MNEQSEVAAPEPSGLEFVLSLFQGLSSFAILVALASLAFAAWSYRRNRRATDIQGLIFDVGASGMVTIANSEPATRKYWPSASATGPGVRYGARTVFWHGNSMMRSPKWDPDVRGRFDLESEPMRGEVTIPENMAPRVWFGIAWDTVAGRGIRTEFVRVNLHTHEMQRWKWFRFVGMRRRWSEQTRLRVLGGGQRRQAGRWKSVAGDTTPEWQFPT